MTDRQPDGWVVWRHLTHGIAACMVLGLLNAALLVAILVVVSDR
jgi:hypothetical protein